jgi:7-cyano-7-deazaguanine synthase
MSDARRAVVLVSGGLDSATTLAMAVAEGCRAYALSFDYGQRHRHELRAAEDVARSLGAVEHRVMRIDLRVWGGSALTADLDVPKGRDADEMGASIPVTYVPARNTIFLSCALGYAEVLDARDIYIGVNALDYSGYPDCRPEYLRAFEEMANLATKAAVEGSARIRVHAPLVEMTKAEIVRRGRALGVDFAMTHSCYDPSTEGLACGECDACLLRKMGFAEADVPDPTQYAPPEGG